MPRKKAIKHIPVEDRPEPEPETVDTIVQTDKDKRPWAIVDTDGKLIVKCWYEDTADAYIEKAKSGRKVKVPKFRRVKQGT